MGGTACPTSENAGLDVVAQAVPPAQPNSFTASQACATQSGRLVNPACAGASTLSVAGPSEKPHNPRKRGGLPFRRRTPFSRSGGRRPRKYVTRPVFVPVAPALGRVDAIVMAPAPGKTPARTWRRISPAGMMKPPCASRVRRSGGAAPRPPAVPGKEPSLAPVHAIILAMNVTMKDIAQELGISIGTVSKVLRDHPDISPETRERVRKRMRELNYRPNLAARALVTGRTHTIGLVVPDLVHPFFGEVAGGLSRLLRKQGYGLIISSSDEDLELENRAIEQLLARRVDALILASSQKDPDFFRIVEEQKTPFILIDRKPEGAKVNFVGVDDEEIGRMATEHLIEMGCRRIAHIGGPGISTAIGRLRGYRQALERHGLPIDPKYVISREHADEASDASGYEAMNKLLAVKQPPDGVFCYNDPTAMGAMQGALDKGIRIPRDLALIGAGNVRYAKFLRVPLSTIDQHSDDIGDRAARLALKLIESKTQPRPKSILLSPRLVVRESSARR